MPRVKPEWVIIAGVLLLVLLGEFGRRVLFGHALYAMNLRERARLARMPKPERGEKILIFAPHPDDETLGCGGLIQRAVDAGAQVHVVLMTNGEYPELSVLLFEETVRRAPQQFIRLGYMRQQETLKAVRYLGLPATAVTFFGYPNQYLDQMWLPGHWLPGHPVRSGRTRATRSPYRNSFTPGALYCGQSMLSDVEAVLRRERPDRVIAVHSNDIHPDHWPTGTCVRFALEELAAGGEGFARRCRYAEYVIHRDHWPVPRRYRPALTLEPPAALVEARQTDWLALPVTLLQTARKRHAISLYRTQAGSFDPLLLSFARANDLFGEERIRSWPDAPVVPDRELLLSPLADLDSAATHPSGDIRSLWLERRESRLLMRLITAQPPSPDVSYHLAIHAGGADPNVRTLVQIDWRGAQTTGITLDHGVLGAIPAAALSVSIAGSETRLALPCPLRPEHRFFLVRAWTTRGRALVDQSATALLRIGGPH